MAAAVAADYRYVLTREIPTLDARGTVVFVMLNPSTADQHTDDATTRRVTDFAARWGFSRLDIVNLYAFRSTDPSALFTAARPIGDENDDRISGAVEAASLVVLAWGATAHPGGTARVWRVLHLISATRNTPTCLGLTADGHPRHPLYVRKLALPQPFHPATICHQEGRERQ